MIDGSENNMRFAPDENGTHKKTADCSAVYRHQKKSGEKTHPTFFSVGLNTTKTTSSHLLPSAHQVHI
jgi:hypothetical protein